VAAAANKIHRGVYFLTRGKHIVSWFDLEKCSAVIEDGTIGQNTYDFLLVFNSELWPYILLFLRYSGFYVKVTLLGDCDL